jgi:hypothetical protein
VTSVRRRRRETAVGDSEIVDPPPDFIELDPEYETIDRGVPLLRIYAPGRYGAGPTRFRIRGPYKRFDHQRAGPSGRPRIDQRRGILYAGATLVGCVGEYFGDTGEIVRTGNRLARLSVLAPLKLLDLRGTAATGAGSLPAIGAITQRATTQMWARWWYEHPQLAGTHGLIYSAAHSGEDATALWERARGRIACRGANRWSLDDLRLDNDLHFAASRLRLALA